MNSISIVAKYDEIVLKHRVRKMKNKKNPPSVLKYNFKKHKKMNKKQNEIM